MRKVLTFKQALACQKKMKKRKVSKELMEYTKSFTKEDIERIIKKIKE